MCTDSAVTASCGMWACRKRPPGSTLAYANEHRPRQLYDEVFHQLPTQAQALAAQSSGRRKFRFAEIPRGAASRA